LVINATTGVITGTPTTPGTSSTVTVTITDSDGVAVTSLPFTWTVLPAPTIGSLGTVRSTVGSVDSIPVAYTCPTANCTLTLTGTVPGLGLSATTVAGPSGTAYIAGTVQPTAVTTGTSQAYAPRVKITDGTGANVTSAAGAWTIFLRPTVGPVGTRTVTVGAAKNVAIDYTCPNTSCVLTLANSVPGLGLSTVNGATAANATTSLTVSAASGTIYINGTVTSSAVPSGTTKPYALSLTITDADNATANSSGTWTASTAPNIVNPGSQAMETYQNLSLQMVAACPNGGCTWQAQAQTPSDPTTWYPITISATGVITYTSAPPGAYTVRVTATDSDNISNTVTFPLVVQDFALNISNRITPRPSTSNTVVTIDVAAAMSPIAAGYTYSISGQPSWVTINAAGLITGTVTPTTTKATSTISVTVTSKVSGTSYVTDPFTWQVS
jgi:hypothetical protein